MSSTSTKRDEPGADEDAGRLSVVATPIGNLDDITLRALATLRSCDAILAEDTRRTKRLCAHHGVGTQLRSFHAHSKDAVVDKLVAELESGAHLSLVTDAGTPVVSDPGIRLVASARTAGIAVETIPGPSAVTAAVAVAGIRSDTFRFVGFLPRGGGRRRRVIEEIGKDRGATVIFEAANRLSETLADFAEVVGPERGIAMCRELTKVHEEVFRGSIAELTTRAEEGVRGEITLVLEGTGLAAGAVSAIDPAEARSRAQMLLSDGLSPRDAARRLCDETTMSRKAAYTLVIALTKDREGST